MADPAFTCRMCGCCCQGQGGILLTERDTERLAAHLGLSVAEMLERYTEPQDGKRGIRCAESGACVFQTPEGGCGVHAGRPDVCRAWPFFRGNLVDESSWRMIQDYCPGVNPEVGFAEFVRQGLDYLRGEGLCREGLSPEDREACPNALLAPDEER